MSSLTQEIANRCQAVLRLSKQQGAMLHELRRLDLRIHPGRFQELMIEIQSLQCSLQAECNSIKVVMAAETVTGGSPMQASVSAHDLELHPANWTDSQGPLSAPELQRMQDSLHRAGDHTMDSNDGDEREVLP